MKRLEKILVNAVGAIVVLYAAIVLLFSLPFMQGVLADWTAGMLSRQLKARVEIGSMSLGFLHRVIINDMTLYEPTGARMASVARVSASINVFSLLSGQVNIGTAQLFGVKATLYKDTPTSQPNFQFLVDAFSSAEDEEPSAVNLHVGSFIMRHVDVAYDVRSEEVHPHSMDVNHLRFSDCGVDVVLRCWTDDSLNIAIRRFQAKELNSGLSLRNTRLKLVANRRSATLSDFLLALPHSYVSVDELSVQYGSFQADSTFRVQGTPINGCIALHDLAPVCDKWSQLYEPVWFSMEVEGDEREVAVKELSLHTDNEELALHANARIAYPLSPQGRSVHADIGTFRITDTEMLMWADALMPRHGGERLMTEVGALAYTGTLSYSARALSSAGALTTGIGDVEYDLVYHADGLLTGTMRGDSIHLGKLKGDDRLGTTSFGMEVAMNLANGHPFPAGTASGTIQSIYYNGYNYHDITLNVRSTQSQVAGTADINDEHLQAHADFAYTDVPMKDIQLQLLLERLNPNKLNLIAEHEGESVSLSATANLHGDSFEYLYGSVCMNDIRVSTPTHGYSVGTIQLHAEREDEGTNRYTVGSEFLSGCIQGNVGLGNLAASVINQLASHIPILVKPVEPTRTNFTYDVTLCDAPILHHLTDLDFSLDKPIRLFGHLDHHTQRMAVNLSAPQVVYNGNLYDDVAVVCNTTAENMNVHAIASMRQENGEDEDVPPSSTRFDVTADVHNNRIDGELYIDMEGRNSIVLQLLPVVQLSDSLGKLKTDITLRRSDAVINDTAWTVSPSRISLYNKSIECRRVKFANNNTNSALTIDGRASTSPTDSLVATLNNLEIKYLLSLLNFNAVRFAGKASGRAVVNNVLGDGTPDVRANLFVEDLSVQEGAIGDANIQAHWDKEVEGLAVEGRIVDLYTVPDGLTGQEKNMTGVTTVEGWISPAKNDMVLNINTHNTNAAFVHGFLGNVFTEVTGYVTGALSVIGPLNNVNIVGDAVPNMNLRLRATNVPYHIEGDTIRLRPYLFDFQDISLYDRFGHRSIISGQVTHRNMKNFAYRFNAELHELLAYDEAEFNSDKFLATVFADGELNISGSDGRPLYVNASITPTRGSLFAYDAATPDAISGSHFIEFHDRDSLLMLHPVPSPSVEVAQKDSLAIVREARKNYSGDIFINFDINLTPDCEVKLRMNNSDDGYMRTFGNARLTAKWYNKGSFQLFGNYNIDAGSYRLYLQSLIFRDLAIQPGSIVEFNGNPFDANIHLICHHTINSVPLSDLTSTTAFSQNNKVKVVCVLDITGKLGNMDFKFDMELPNVNEEVRQLVRSMINSEEEMNTQMIYLLGLGRFYPNEYARANGGDNSTQAMNSLLSSTLSGQINQMISNVIGNNTNWNFGSSLTTGERGWNDLDVEGILSGRLLDDRLLINGNFGYRDNAMTNQSSFIGDFEVKWRMSTNGDLYLKAYNQTNDRYFTKSTINTQGIGLSWQHDFERIRRRLKEKEKKSKRGKKL